MNLGKISKAIVSAVTGLSVLAAIFLGTDIKWLTPELISGIGAVVAPYLVWVVRNKTQE